MPPASFRPHLTMDPLPLAVCLLWSYRTRDFHPLDYTHAGRTPLWCLTAPPSPRGIGRATKGKRLYGQARRLTSPDLHILCRMCTVDNKAPQSNPFTQRIAKNKVPPPGGRWWRQPPKGVHFLARQGGCMVSLRAKARLYSFPSPSVVP